MKLHKKNKNYTDTGLFISFISIFAFLLSSFILFFQFSFGNVILYTITVINVPSNAPNTISLK